MVRRRLGRWRLWWNIAIGDISTSTIFNMRYSLKRPPRTADQRVSVIKSLTAHARLRGYRPDNPANGIPSQVSSIVGMSLPMVQQYPKDIDQERIAIQAMKIWAEAGK